MGKTNIQIPSIILPAPGATYVATAVETINDLVVHNSVDISMEYMGEKTIFVWATEVVIAGAPGNLNFTLEASPYASTVSVAYFAQVGAGPAITIVPTGVHGTVHTGTFSWVAHAPFARVVAQMPVAAAPATAYFVVQVLYCGKST